MGMVRGIVVFGLVVFCWGGLNALVGAEPKVSAKNFQVPVDYKAFSGFVVDEDGRPLSGVQVNLMQMDGIFSSHSGRHSDDAGSVTLYLKNGASGVVFANIDGDDQRRVADCAVVSGTPEPVKLVLKSQGRKLAGTVVDEDGKPVPQALIGVVGTTNSSVGTIRHFRVGLIQANMLTAEADDSGHFEIQNLPSLPIAYWTAKPGDKKSLFGKQINEPYTIGADLGQGDSLDYTMVLR